MKRAVRQCLWMIGGAVGLIALAGWQWQRDRAQDPGSLLDLSPASVTQVELRLGQGATERYSRHDGHWWRTDGTPVRADDGRLGEMADTAAAAVLSWRPANDFVPAKIGLSPPLAVLSLDGQRLEFGEMSVTGPQRYVRVGDRVALISVRYMPRPVTGEVRQLQ